MARQIDESGNLSMYISAEKTKFYMVKEMGENTYAHLYVAATTKCKFHTVIQAVKESTS